MKDIIQKFIEKKHFVQWSFFSLFVLMIADIFIRIAIEIFTLEKMSPYGQYNLEMCSTQGENYYIFIYYYLFFVENISYFLLLFMFLTFLITTILNTHFINNKINYIQNTSPIDIIKTSLIFYPLIVIPPLIDYFILGRNYGYDYGNSDNFLLGLLTLTWQGYDGKGISTLVTLGVITTSLYVWFTTKNIYKTLLTFILTNVIIVSMSMPNIIFGKSLDNFFNPMFLPFYYLIPLFFIGIVFGKFIGFKINFTPFLLCFPVLILSSYLLFHYNYHFMDNLIEEIKKLSTTQLKMYYGFNGFFIYVCTLYLYSLFKYFRKPYFDFINLVYLFYITLCVIYFSAEISLDFIGVAIFTLFLLYIVNFLVVRKLGFKHG